MKTENPIKVSLDEFRTPGVRIFGGEGRGKVVAEEIVRRHGKNVEILIPKDVICISTHFIYGFNSVIPGALTLEWRDQ